MNRSRHSVPCAAAVALFVAALPSAAAPPPLADPAYGGNGDGIARVPATLVPMVSAYGKHAVVQADGRLVMIGDARRYVLDHYESQLVLARLDAGGELDATFGTDHDGLVRTAFPGDADDIAQTADGKLVYAGHDMSFASMIVGRLAADGTADTSFFGSGRRLIGPSALQDGAAQGYFASVLPLPGGKMLALGMVVVLSTPAQYFSCATRLSADGSTDAGFGDAGRLCIAPALPSGVASQALGGLVLADGRILLAGASRHPGGSSWDMSVARLTADGALDTRFGPAHDGWAFAAFDQGGTMIDAASAVAVDGQGRILLAGYFEGVNGMDIGVARLLPDGQPDSSFGSLGRVQIALDLGGFDDDRAHSIAVRPDGGILVGGSADEGVGAAILLEPDGRLDPRFGAGGVFLQADPGGPQAAKVDSQQQFPAGDHLYMIGSALDADGHYGFAATRSVMPLFADGFE